MIDRNTSPFARVVVGDTQCPILFASVPYDHGSRSVTIIADEEVWRLHGKRFPGKDPVLIPSGEASKDLTGYSQLLNTLLEREIDRNGLIISLGGGVTSDLAGFAAATFRRGVGFGAYPTTLLSMVDAALGGKNGINVGGVKNVVGTIRQPEFVILDPSFLETLPEPQIRSGLAEVVKTAAIADENLFATLEKLGQGLYDPSETRDEVIRTCASIKARVVTEDAYESGLRRILNFGHTLGHAVEKPGTWSHGEAVASGMVFAAKVSVHLGHLEAAQADRLERLLERLGLPTHIPYDPKTAMAKIAQDKKRNNEGIHFVVLNRLGSAATRTLSFVELEGLLHDLQ